MKIATALREKSKTEAWFEPKRLAQDTVYLDVLRSGNRSYAFLLIIKLSSRQKAVQRVVENGLDLKRRPKFYRPQSDWVTNAEVILSKVLQVSFAYLH